MRVFHQLADVDLDREPVSLKMPTQDWPVLHIFALSLEKPGQ